MKGSTRTHSRITAAAGLCFCVLLYLPCTVLPDNAKVFFGQLSPGHDSTPLNRKGTRPLFFRFTSYHLLKN